MVSIAQAQLFFLALTRVLAMMVQVPNLGGRLVPVPVRLGLGLLLTMVLVPWQGDGAVGAELDWMTYAGQVGRELLLGTLVGFAAALVFGALQVAGEAMGQGSGFSAAHVLNPALDTSGSPYDQLFVMIAMLLFLVMDGHHVFLLAVRRTFEVAPMGTSFAFGSAAQLGTTTSHLIAAGVQLALPVLGALLLADLALGVLARVAPQVSVFFLGLPLKVAVAILSLALALPVILPGLRSLFTGMGEHMLRLLGG